MVSNGEFQILVEGYHPELKLTVNNNFTNLGALYYRGRLLCAVPRNHFPLENVYEDDGVTIKYPGLIRVAKKLYDFGKLTGVLNHPKDMHRTNFEHLCISLGIRGKDYYDLMTLCTGDAGWNKVELRSPRVMETRLEKELVKA